MHFHMEEQGGREGRGEGVERDREREAVESLKRNKNLRGQEPKKSRESTTVDAVFTLEAFAKSQATDISR